ncbi:MAG: CoA transferase [Dehalococcoidia bacterium]|nr:CoA transferase [Dehalococcoidia bacterium]
MNGPMHGLRVLEYTDHLGTWAGKLLADMGAEVIKVEPPGGEVTRTFQPFLEEVPGQERSLYWWHYNTNKQSIVLDLSRDEARDIFRRLAADADFLVESAPPGMMAELGLDYPDLAPANERLIYISITPFGRTAPRAEEQATDITLMANGGIAWMNGYDDHSLPPVRGGGNQAYHTACHYAVMSGLVALLHRDNGGTGQHIDVNTNAAINVTNEAGSYTWLVAQQTVQRQTGRHAAVKPSMPSQVLCADGKYANTGVPPRRGEEFRKTYDWLGELGIATSSMRPTSSSPAPSASASTSRSSPRTRSSRPSSAPGVAPWPSSPRSSPPTSSSRAASNAASRSASSTRPRKSSMTRTSRPANGRSRSSTLSTAAATPIPASPTPSKSPRGPSAAARRSSVRTPTHVLKAAGYSADEIAKLRESGAVA